MAQIRYQQVGKRYGSVHALEDLNLEVEDKEFVTLVGPSGCGKSTTLNLTAGLDDPSAGEIYIDDQLINAVPPGKRDIAMVFQSYALYPHKSVRENIGFGLKVRKMPREEIEERVQEAAELLEIAHLLDRKPRQLSGGQRQRVALGRAITRNPKAFLLDEPLSNLDAKLRIQMRAELKLLFERVQGTVLYVTHDQAEAMTLSHRVVVMNLGRVQQVGTPLDVYNQPRNLFVAGFLGSPSMNVLDCHVQVEDGTWRVHLEDTPAAALSLTAEDLFELGLAEARERLHGQAILGIRPEDIAYEPQGGLPQDPEGIPCQVMVVEPMGSLNILVVSLGGQLVTVSTGPDRIFSAGEHGRLSFNRAKIHFFDRENEQNLRTWN